MKNLNFCIATLEAGGYFAAHRSQVTSGYAGGIIGVGLHDKDNRCLLTDCKAEFNQIKEIVKLREVPWSAGHMSGIEYYLEG